MQEELPVLLQVFSFYTGKLKETWDRKLLVLKFR